MRFEPFRTLVQQLADEVPEHYLDGVAAIDVSPRTVPHPIRADVFTLGECIPIDTGTDEVVSRVVLYHGSFRALAALREDFDWREEARETLVHELRHHLEWRANTERLEAYDWAAEQNFARIDGAPFDPLFYEAGERVADDAYRVNDDIFIERVVREIPPFVPVMWRGRRYRVRAPAAPLPIFLTLSGLPDPPDGAVVLVLRRKARLWNLLRRADPPTLADAVAVLDA